jgi:hypothetical protein
MIFFKKLIFYFLLLFLIIYMFFIVDPMLEGGTVQIIQIIFFVTVIFIAYILRKNIYKSTSSNGNPHGKLEAILNYQLEEKRVFFPVGFLLLGFLYLILGVNGKQIAISFSRLLKNPKAEWWETSEILINTFMYIPMIFGIIFLILFIITFSISYYNWQK